MWAEQQGIKNVVEVSAFKNEGVKEAFHAIIKAPEKEDLLGVRHNADTTCTSMIATCFCSCFCVCVSCLPLFVPFARLCGFYALTGLRYC